MDLESLNILHEICFLNGIQSENLNQDEHFLNQKLFLLFNNFKKCISLQNFPFLTELYIISQNITKITKLETCPNLKKLWLCECFIEKIENLNSCKQLVQLYLYDNNIKKIENLTNNQQLEYLWLNNNQIYMIEGLNHLKLLKQLNLSGNLIINLNENLLSNQQLIEISLSGNQLWNINDLLLLNKLPYLTKININESEYNKNPLCYNINLPMILINQLPQLSYIDHIYIDYIDLKDTIKTMIQHKKYYYIMKYEHDQSIIEKKLNSLKLLFNQLQNKIYIHIQYIDKAIRLLQNAIKKQENINTMYDHSISINRIDQLNKKINYWENIHDKYQCKYNLLCNRLKEHLHFRQHIYDLELQMFGYIEIKEINNNDHLFIDCNEFLNSRFCYHHMNGSIINGIKILHLYKINNRIFNENDNNNKSSTKKLKSSINNQSIKYSTFSDYLFIVCPEKIDELKLYMNIIRNGLQINNQYKLTNNLNIADNKKLQVINQYYSEGNFNPYDHITRLLLMKVSKFTHPNLSNNNNNNNNHNDNQEDQLYVENILFYENQSNCYCFSQIKKPDLLQNKLLYPEYIVELEYILKNNQSNSILDPFNIETNFEFNTHFDKFDEEIKMDQNFIKTISVLSSSSIEDHNHLDHLNEILNNDDELLHNSMNFYLDQTHLLIINTKITKKLQFFDFSNLTYISITHCQLDNLSFIPCNNNNNLMTLIINHNQLNSLESLGYMPNLIELQVDYNQLTCIIENVSILLLNTPKLEKLSWRYNPWINDKFIKMYTLYKLPTIKLFNFQLINNDDIQLANELFNSSIITSNMIENVYKNDIQCNNNDFDQNLTIFPIAYYHHYNQYFYNNTIQSMNKLNYFHLITSLCLQSLNLYKIENLTHLTNLKYLSLNYNFIKKIEGLTHCNNLIELSVEYNLIESIDNIDHLIKLQSLLLSNNKIKKINKLQFKSLLNLSKLNLNNNQIDNIDGIDYCQQLIELYLGNNQLKHFINILYLKHLSHLNILELYGNPLCDLINNNYFYQLIYYIKSIKSIDGYIITMNDLIKSNELYDGHLSYEYLLNYLNHDQFINIVELNLSKCMLYKIDYIDPNQLIHLKCINLEKNYLKSFGGLLFFKNLQMICLNDNNIESLFSNYIYTLAINDHHHHHNQKINPIELHFINLYKSKQPIYPYLNVLHLAHNNIHSLKELQFHRMSNLQTLFLQNNELITLNGIEGLNQLKELVLDNNKIKFINDLTFLYNWTLSEIHLENNLLNELNQLSKLENLKRLYVGANKLTNFIDLENFAKNQPNLYEISLIDNPITTRQIHRLILIYYIPKLQIIDGIQITIEERDRILDFYKELELSNIINCGMIQSSNWYHQSIGKINNPICEMTLPEIINKKSLISSITMNDHIDLSNHSKEENQTIFVYGKQIHQHININNNCPLNKTKLNMKHHSIQSDMNEKNALTIKSIHNHSKNSFVGNLIHYQHQYIKQKDQCSMPEINKLSINSITRPLSQTNKVNQLKSLKHNKNNDNNNNNCYIKTTKNITIHADSNSNRSGNSNNNLIKFSAMSTNFQR
ncbi:Leucine-rich repeat-containing protein 9 [Schistosoma haematobium]|uniref:Leucine-rich repeat-containing protein 9 n=1 Tax=Schistosoma haematobium TaxID=6185 RepID=A0A6A5DIP9_SCHHA|nr:Leucine-rich repeat-containing protein 9 [Schistosoma haematobium]KAH9584607.1 Leucine-rich repeat-containing protein 9 [Schistosoma haematobium]CAH8503357.1 unnamed protein product [Schistosoma haematobium]